MSEQIAKLNIEEKLIACIELVQKRQADIQALRAENARLRGAVESFHNSIPAYSKKKLHGLQGEYWSPAGMMIDTELIANLYAALQPERGGIQAAHVQACMECGKPVNDHQHLGSSISFHPTRKP